MSNSNPGWTYGFVPTAGQWNAQWSIKQDWNTILDNIIAQGGAPSFIAPASWKPTDGSGAGLTFSSVSAEYCAIGNILFAYATLTYPTTASTAAAVISGLPNPVPGAAYSASPGLLYVVGGAAALITAVGSSNSAAIYSLSAGTAVENATLSGKTISFQLGYPLS